jgi:GNAT superfamily N-acetyltransferase
MNVSEELNNLPELGITIRLATDDDATSLAKLRYSFRSSLDQTNEDKDKFVQRCGRWMRERLREDNCWRCWIAEQDHTLVGNVWVQLIEKIPNPVAEAECHAYLTNFYISAHARGKGVGTRLLMKVLEWCETQDVQTVLLWPTQRSRTLYERQGFSVRTDLLGLQLEEWTSQ